MSVQSQEEQCELEHTGSVIHAVVLSFAWISMGYALSFSSNSVFIYTKIKILSDSQGGIYGGLLAFGALVGSWMYGGVLKRKLGLYWSVVLASVVSSVGWYLHVFVFLLDQAKPINFFIMLTLARAVVGFGCGVLANCVPVGVTEICPPHKRHIYGASSGLSLNFGFFLGYLLGWALIKVDTSNAAVSTGRELLQNDLLYFHYSLGFAPLFGMFLCFVGVVSVSISRGYLKDEASDVAITISPAYYEESDPLSSNSISQLAGYFLDPVVRKQFIIGGGLMLLQQLLGINAVIFNATSIFQYSISSSDPTFGALVGVFLGSAICLSNLGSLLFGHFFKRNTTMHLCSGALLLLDLLLGFDLFYHWPSKIFGCFAVIAYVLIFFCSWSTVVWQIVSEIYRSDLKTVGMAFSTSIMWIFTGLMSFIYPMLSNAVGVAGVFWIFSGTTFFSIIFVYRLVPETKHQSEAQIQAKL